MNLEFDLVFFYLFFLIFICCFVGRLKPGVSVKRHYRVNKELYVCYFAILYVHPGWDGRERSRGPLRYITTLKLELYLVQLCFVCFSVLWLICWPTK